MTNTGKSYTELLTFRTFKERFLYLKLDNKVGEETFGVERYLNQRFYKSRDWINVRNFVIARDLGCDLGIAGLEVSGKFLIHHITPITVNDLAYASDRLLDPENLITVSHSTHNAIHYGDSNLMELEVTIRSPNDTCPWKK